MVVHGCSDVGVTHQLLLHSKRSSQIIEQCPIRVAKGILTEPRDTDRVSCRVQMIISQRIGVEWPAPHANARAPLSQIISVLDERFGTEFTEEDHRLFFQQSRKKLSTTSK